MPRVIYLAAVIFTALFIASPAQSNDFYFKACDNYVSGQLRNCTELKSVKYRSFSRVVLHIYSDLTWTVGQPRVQSDIFMRWLHRKPTGEIMPIAGPSTSPSYRWRPSKTSPVTRWHIQATTWRDLEGVFLFQAFTDPGDPAGSLIEQIIVPIERD